MRPNPQFPTDLVTFTEEILNGKLHFLCSASWEDLKEGIRIKLEFSNFAVSGSEDRMTVLVFIFAIQ